MMTKKILGLLVACAIVTLQILNQTTSVRADEHQPEIKAAVCVLSPTRGNNKVRGRIMFQQREGSTRVTGQVRGLTPGEHGFHIHEFGDLRERDGTSAGGHYNPEGHMHGGLDSAERHVGDLGNITANAEGLAKVRIDVKGLMVHYILGRSIVVHAGADDLKSQPSGDAGARVAVGVIGIAQPQP